MDGCGWSEILNWFGAIFQFDEVGVFCKLWLWHHGKMGYHVWEYVFTIVMKMHTKILEVRGLHGNNLSLMVVELFDILSCDDYSRKKKMDHILDLPYEMLTTILIMLASSYGGAGDLVRLSSTCAKFMSLASRPHVLKAVNFRSLTLTKGYEPHHTLNGLLCQCAQAGNLTAEAMLGRALLFNDYWFWNVLNENGKPLIAREGPASGVLLHEKLVRSFIAYGGGADMAPMRIPLFSYMISFLGYDVARQCGILLAVTNLCSFEIIRLKVRNLSNIPEYSGNNVSMNGLNDAMARLTPPSGAAHRERLLALFDEFFPSPPI